MQEWGAVLRVSQATVQASFAGFVVAFGAMQLVFGPLSDRHGRRPVLLGGLIITLAGSVLGWFARDVDTVILARVLQGAGSAAGSVAGRASVQDHFDGAARTRVMAYVGMVMGACPPAAMIVGGLLHERFGWQSNFALSVLLVLVVSAAAWRLPATRPRGSTGSPGDAQAANVQPSWWRAAWASYARLLRERGFVPLVLVMGFTAAAFYTFMGAAPLVLRGYGIGPGRVGLYIMVVPLSYVAGNFVTSRLARRHGNVRLMVAGHAVSMLGIVAMIGFALAGWHSPIAFALPLFLFGLGHGLSVPTTLAVTVGLVPAMAGAASALGGVTQQLTGAVGSWAVGWLDHDAGPVPLGLAMLAATLASAAAMATARAMLAADRTTKGTPAV
jgi:DHA1 family bicyclomycin/chloramphenicol resistance-like MFS transporter